MYVTTPLTLGYGSGLPHVQLHVLADVGEEVVVGVQVRDDLVAVVELVLAVMAVHVVHWRLQGTRRGGGGEGEM